MSVSMPEQDGTYASGKTGSSQLTGCPQFIAARDGLAREKDFFTARNKATEPNSPGL